MFLWFRFCWQRKRLSPLWSSKGNNVVVVVPQKKTEGSTKPDPPKSQVITPKIEPLKPIQIPKDIGDERLKQLESPETVELIKTFEIPDKLNGDQPDGSGVSSEKKEAVPKPPEPKPVVKPEPKTPPQPQEMPPASPEKPKRPPSNVMDPQTFGGMKPKAEPLKDMKDATKAFLAEEHDSGQPRSNKRYSKNRPKNQ